jgi:hydrogenase maturation protease
MDTAPPRPLLVAYGNPLRGDDALGWHVAAGVRAAAPAGAIHVLALHQLTPELAEIVARAERVVFVDASCIAAPGALQASGVEPAEAWRGGFTHRCEPAGLLGFARHIHGRTPTDAWLLTVGGECFDLVEGLSAPLARALPQIIRAALDRLLPCTALRSPRGAADAGRRDQSSLASTARAGQAMHEPAG